MIVPVTTLAALLAGAAVCWLVVRRPPPVPVPLVLPEPAERAVWSRSARELYRTVVGVVDDVDVTALLGDPAGAVVAAAARDRGDGPGDPAVTRAWLVGAVTRARGSSTWARTLRDQAAGVQARRACDGIAVGMAELADAAGAALAGPADGVRTRRLEAARRQVRAEAEALVHLL